jgi:hypothetical protein
MAKKTKSPNLKSVAYSSSKYCSVFDDSLPTSHLFLPSSEANTKADFRKHERQRSDSDLSDSSCCTESSGQSIVFDNINDGLFHSPVGNPYYAPPEMLAGRGYDHTADWWAVGVLFFHFVAGVTPFYSELIEEARQNVLNHSINWSALPADKSEFSDLGRDLITQFLQVIPADRLGRYTKILLHYSPQIHAHFFFLTNFTFLHFTVTSRQSFFMLISHALILIRFSQARLQLPYTSLCHPPFFTVTRGS